jgi:hypothetical protein
VVDRDSGRGQIGCYGRVRFGAQCSTWYLRDREDGEGAAGQCGTGGAKQRLMHTLPSAVGERSRLLSLRECQRR